MSRAWRNSSWITTKLSSTMQCWVPVAMHSPSVRQLPASQVLQIDRSLWLNWFRWCPALMKLTYDEPFKACVNREVSQRIDPRSMEIRQLAV